MAQQQQQNKNRSGDWKMKGKAFAELLGSGNITTMRRVKDTSQNWIRDALDRLPSKSVKDPANIKKLRKAWKDTYDALERAYAETVKAVEAEAQKGDKRMSLGGMAREAAYAEWVKGKKGGRRYSLGDTREWMFHGTHIPDQLPMPPIKLLKPQRKSMCRTEIHELYSIAIMGNSLNIKYQDKPLLYA